MQPSGRHACAERARRRFQLEDEELEAELLKCTVKDLKPIHVGDTSAEGAPPVKCRAGKVIKVSTASPSHCCAL